MSTNDKPAMDDPVKKLNEVAFVERADDHVIYSVATRDHHNLLGRVRWRRPALEHGAGGPVAFSRSPLSAKPLDAVGFSVNAPAPIVEKSSIPVAAKVLPAAVNDCVLAQTDPESPTVVEQPLGNGKLPKSTSTPRLQLLRRRTQERQRKQVAPLTELIITHTKARRARLGLGISEFGNEV